MRWLLGGQTKDHDIAGLPSADSLSHHLERLTPGYAVSVHWAHQDVAREHEELAPGVRVGWVCIDGGEVVGDKACPGIPGPFGDMVESGRSKGED